MERDLKQTAAVFKALGDETRLTVLGLLRGGERCACVLLEDLEIGQSSLSYHMKILYEAGLVEGRQDGKWTHYRISARGREDALALLAQATLTDPDAKQEDRACCAVP